MFGSVDRLSSTVLPSLAELLQYEALVVTYDSAPSGYSSVDLGNLLADYVDAGGELVLTTFVFQYDDSDSFGRLESGGYIPASAYVGNYETQTTSPLPEHDLFDIEYDIDSITAYYRDEVVPSPDATVVGTWQDGTPLALIDGGSGVIGLTVYPVPGVHNTPTGDYVELVANAIYYADAYL